MNQVDAYNPRRRAIRNCGRVLSCAAVASAAVCGASYLSDSARLRRVAQQVTQGNSNNSEKVIALMNWVHGNKGFHENDSFFLVRRLRATPLQVLETGGDCADKSRLLCALLREVGISSTMVMCFHRDTGVATHTVVEAQTASGEFMVVDPVYALSFPRGADGGFYGLLDLRAEPQIVDRRISELLESAPRNSPLRSYNPRSAAYDLACSIHWNKNFATRAARSLLALWSGNDVYRLRRPLVLEEPKLFVAAGFLLIAACILVAARIAESLLESGAPKPVLAGAALCGR